MKRSFLLFFVLILNLSFAQTNQFVYRYISVPDSTQIDVSESEIMILNINDDKSEFFSFNAFQSDSTMSDGTKKGLWIMLSDKKMSNYRVEKFNNSNELKFITPLGNARYFVDQNTNFNWKLYPEYTTILNFKAQKATTEFGGRQWTAWFAKDIPFQDGPYKFEGLPGLIVKIEDSTKSHLFELVGIKNFPQKIIYPQINNFKEINIENSKYIKLFKNYRLSPMADMVGRYPDQTDSEGNFRTGQQIFREVEKTVVERLKKENNIIEIDLLKQ